MTRTFGSAVAVMMGGKILGLIATVIATPIIVRLLGAEQYGIYATLMALFGLLMVLASSGVNEGIRKYLSEDRAAAHWKDNVFSYYFRLAAILALLAMALLLAAAELGLVHRVLGRQYAPYFTLLAILTIAAQFRDYLRRALMGLKLEHVSEPIAVVYKLLYAVIAIALVYVGFGVNGLLAAHIVASGVAIAAAVVIIRRHLSLARLLRPVPSSFPKAKMLSFNHFAILYLFLLTTVYHVDVLMLSVFSTSANVGYYKAALVLVHFLWFVPKSIQAVMVQETSDLWRREAIQEINPLAAKTTRYTLLLTLLMAAGLGVLAPVFVPFYYGADFSPAVLPLILLLPGTVGFAVARPIMAISVGKGDMRLLAVANGAAAAMNFLLNLVLIPPFGMAGAAVATSIGYGSLPLFHVLAARSLGYRPMQDLRLRQTGVTTVGTLLAIGGLAFLITNSLVAIVLIPPVGLLIFTSLALATRAITLKEVCEALSQLPPPVNDAAQGLLNELRGLAEYP